MTLLLPLTDYQGFVRILSKSLSCSSLVLKEDQTSQNGWGLGIWGLGRGLWLVQIEAGASSGAWIVYTSCQTLPHWSKSYSINHSLSDPGHIIIIIINTGFCSRQCSSDIMQRNLHWQLETVVLCRFMGWGASDLFV